MPISIDYFRFLLNKNVKLLDSNFSITNEIEMNPDDKEATQNALLANETLTDNAINFENRTGIPSVGMGKICFTQLRNY